MKRLWIQALLALMPMMYHAQKNPNYFVMNLGIVQDGGFPHLGCTQQCCSTAWEDQSIRKNIVSLALVDSLNKKWYLFEATPDLKTQLNYFQTLTNGRYSYLPDGIFITHAHIGHYTGLMQLGKEVMNTSNVKVYVLPKMKQYLETNGPWSQLVKMKNIDLRELKAEKTLSVSDSISVLTFTVPHRDEYSETAGFKTSYGKSSFLFIPDIDKWEKWNRSITEFTKDVDHAFIDATFYSEKELKNRNIKEIPHPLVVETMELFKTKDQTTKHKVVFTHFNHTNPLLLDKDLCSKLEAEGYRIARQGARYH